MPTIKDHLDAHGGESFDELPFCEADNYVVCKLVNPNFTGALSEEGEPVPVGEAFERLFALRGEEAERMGALASPQLMPLLRRLPETERYRDLKLSGYVRRIRPDKTEQFSALTVHLPDGRRYAAFRGTDDTLLGWKENFLMAVQLHVEAQKDAAAYLLSASERWEGPLLVGGHSKGGNLAVYAAAMVPEEVQERVLGVYNFDGPGFLPEFYTEPGYLRIRPQVRTFLPRHSLVGTLLTREKWAAVTECRTSGAAAHDGFTWEVKDGAFVRAARLSRSSRAFEETMDQVLERLSLEERRQFIEELFDALGSTGAVTVTDLTENRLSQAIGIAGSFRRGTGTRRFVLLVLGQLLKSLAAQSLGLD